MQMTWKLSVFVAVTILGALPVRAAREVRPEYQPIVPGLDYAHIQMTNWNKPEPWSIHVARLDRSEKNLRLVSTLARTDAYGPATISTVAKLFPQTVGEPLVLVNTGFMNKKKPYLGAPRGLVISDGELITGPSKYSFWMNGDGAMSIGVVEPEFSAQFSSKKTVPFILNKACQTNEVVLFTHRIGKFTYATNQMELVLEDPKRKPISWRAGQSYSLVVKAINPGGNSALSSNVAVLCFGDDVAKNAAGVRVGDKIKIQLKTSPDISKAVAGSECIFPIVTGGKVLTEFDSGKYLLGKHPRTAIGFNDRYFFMVVVDGRQKDLSMGMSPTELGELMAALGCTEAANQDGGGSTTFWADGKRRNSVPGGQERSRSDALVIVQTAGKSNPALRREAGQ